jgi:hypothetical protein
MAPIAPQTAAAGSASLAAYHSAYDGYVLDRNGRFTHFVRQPDRSHLENGYWRFTSSRDEHLAYERGYHTPEDIMVAADSGEHNDEISLLWLPGTVDPNLKSHINGSPKAHLRNIYDMRLVLRKALSFRGRVPTYPVSHLLKEYWEVRCTAWSLPAERYMAQASMEPTLMSLQSEGMSSPIVTVEHQDTLSSQGLYSSDPVITTAATSAVRSPAQSPDMTGTPPAPNHYASPKSSPKHARVSQHAENITASSQPAAHYTATPNGTASAGSRPMHSIARPYNASPHVEDTPRRHNGQAQDVQRIQASQLARILAPNGQHQQSHPSLAVQSVQQSIRPLQAPVPSLLQHSTYAINSDKPGAFSGSQSFSPYTSSPYMPPSGQSTPPPLWPSGGYPRPPASPTGDTQDYSAPRARVGRGHQYKGTASKTHAIPQAPTLKNAVPRHQQLKKQALSIDLRLTQHDQHAPQL